MAIGRPIEQTPNIADKVVTATATAGQTEFTVTGGYRINHLAVFRNGVRLVNGNDYTALDGTTVTLMEDASNLDILEFQVFDSFSVSDALLTNSASQTVNGDVTVNGAFTVGSGGIGTFTAATVVVGIVSSTTGITTVQSLQASSSTTTGALVVKGGVGIGKSLYVGGNVSVGGTLTYEDVTNVDSVGLVTAGKGLRVTTGGLVVTAGVSTFAGITTVTNTAALHSKQLNVSAGSTFGGAVTLSDTLNVNSNSLGVDASGRVLIGTATEGHAHADNLTVADSSTCGMTIRSGTTSTGNIYFSDATSGDAEFSGAIEYDHSSNSLRLHSNEAEKLRIDSSGRVLIASTTSRTIWGANPQTQIEKLDSNAALSVIRNTNSASGPWIALCKSRGSANGAVTIVQDGDSLGSINWFGADGVDLNNTSAEIRAEIDGTPGSDDVPGRLIFKTTADGAASATERLRIDAAGMTGVRTAVPRATLHVKAHDNNWEGGLLIEDNTGNDGWNFHPESSDASLLIGYNDDTSLALASQAASTVIKLTSTGHMGLGVSPSAWPTNADSTALQIGTGFAAFGRGSGDQDRGGIAVNYYTDGSSNYYIGNGNANRIYMNDGNIDFQYAGTNSSGAGQALTFTNAVRIDTSGNLLVNRTAWVDNHFDNGIYIAGSTQAGLKYMRTASGSAATWDTGIDTDGIFKFVYTGDSGGTGTERLRIKTTGEIVQYNNDGSADGAADDLVIGNTTSGVNRGMTIYSHNAQNGCIAFADNDNNFKGAVQYMHNGDRFRILTGGQETFRVQSGGTDGQCTFYMGGATNNQNKSGALTLNHYTYNSYNQIDLIRGTSTSGVNKIEIGGSDSSNGSSAATSIQMYTAANATTNNGTERFRITSAGHVTVFTDDVVFGGVGTLRINSGSTSGALNLDGGASNHGGEINLLGGSNGGRILFRAGQGSGQQTEQMRLTENGQLAIGDDTSTRHSGRFQVINTSNSNETGDTTCFIESSGNDWLMTFNDTDASSSTEHFLYFNRDGTNTGSVYSSSGTTTYATSSDYRLKENVVSITNGISRLKNLKPKRFNFIEFPDKTQDGFLAHEVQEVVPEAASGEKDEVASKNEYNHKVGEAVYQTLDNAKLVPLLTAALQEAISKIETLEAKVAALESA